MVERGLLLAARLAATRRNAQRRQEMFVNRHTLDPPVTGRRATGRAALEADPRAESMKQVEAAVVRNLTPQRAETELDGPTPQVPSPGDPPPRHPLLRAVTGTARFEPTPR
jgi:hypothetical protein